MLSNFKNIMLNFTMPTKNRVKMKNKLAMSVFKNGLRNQRNVKGKLRNSQAVSLVMRCFQVFALVYFSNTYTLAHIHTYIYEFVSLYFCEREIVVISACLLLFNRHFLIFNYQTIKKNLSKSLGLQERLLVSDYVWYF